MTVNLRDRQDSFLETLSYLKMDKSSKDEPDAADPDMNNTFVSVQFSALLSSNVNAVQSPLASTCQGCQILKL